MCSMLPVVGNFIRKVFFAFCSSISLCSNGKSGAMRYQRLLIENEKKVLTTNFVFKKSFFSCVGKYKTEKKLQKKDSGVNVS